MIFFNFKLHANNVKQSLHTQIILLTAKIKMRNNNIKFYNSRKLIKSNAHKIIT